MNKYTITKNMEKRTSGNKSSKRGIPREIYTVSSCQAFLSVPISNDGDDSLFELSGASRGTRSSKKPTGLLELMEELDFLEITARPLVRSEETRKKLGKLYSTMPILKPERKVSSEKLLYVQQEKTGSIKNAVFTNPKPYKKKPNMFESFEMTPTSLSELSLPSVSRPKMKTPIIDMPSLNSMLPMLHRASSSPVENPSSHTPMEKQTRKASLDTSMPLRKPLRKASMDNNTSTCKRSLPQPIIS